MSKIQVLAPLLDATKAHLVQVPSQQKISIVRRR